MSKSNDPRPWRPTGPAPPRADWGAGLVEPLVDGNRVELLADGESAFQAISNAVDGARDHVNVENLVDGADAGRELLQRLAARARQGLRVNLLLDHAQLEAPALDALEPLRQAGVSLAEHDSQAWNGLLPRRCEPRELLVVDGREAFIGGLDAHGGRGTPPPARIGPRLRVQGPVLQGLQRLFIAHWQRFARGPMQPARYFPAQVPAGLQRVGIAAGESGQRNSFVEVLLAAIGSAATRVVLASPCEQPPRRLVQALAQASKRGAEVEVLLPRAGGGLLRGMPLRQALQASGVRVHESQPAQWHARLCVVDGEWVGVGSVRLDWRNVVRDAESGVVVVDPGLAQRLEALFQADVQRGGRSDAAWRGSRARPWQHESPGAFDARP